MNNDVSKIRVNVYKKENDEIVGMEGEGSSFSLPIGFIYVQFPHQKSPDELFGGSWENISNLYAGCFFRAEGGEANTFEEEQQSSGAPNIEGVSGAVYWGQLGASTGAFSATTGAQVPSVGSTYTFAAVDFKASRSNAAYNLTEVRPINHTVRMWKRTA